MLSTSLALKCSFALTKPVYRLKATQGIFLIDIAPNRVSMVDRKKTPFLEETSALRHAVREEAFTLLQSPPEPGIRWATDHTRRVFPWTGP